MRILTASSEQLAAIDRVLDGTTEPVRPERKGPFLLKMGDAAALMGVSRPTLWRMLNAGRLARVEILPETFRVRREEVEAIVFGAGRNGQGKDENFNHQDTNQHQPVVINRHCRENQNRE